jgi:hypothetical protein
MALNYFLKMIIKDESTQAMNAVIPQVLCVHDKIKCNHKRNPAARNYRIAVQTANTPIALRSRNKQGERNR